MSYKKGLRGLPQLPGETEWLLPYHSSESGRVMNLFYYKFYSDLVPRIFLFGINPGRFGAGLTGISFTDPLRLEHICGIPNQFRPKPELSSEFIYEMIDQYGGVSAFYKAFYITSVCPIGLVKNGRNFNYYDDRHVAEAVKPFIIQHIAEQVEMGAYRDLAICIGQGKNATYFKGINEEFGFFKDVAILPHPRWIMQYRRKIKPDYINLYVRVLSDAFKTLN